MLAPRRLHSERPLSPVFAPLLHFSGVYRLLTTELLVLSSIRQLRSGCALTVVSSFSMLITHNDVLTTEYRIKKIPVDANHCRDSSDEGNRGDNRHEIAQLVIFFDFPSVMRQLGLA